ncbi:MAG: putative intracellular serine protease [Prokaryotic dsDNA virus sp.]|nr:MAG: putative intracellular serine protease [Prokaryotic dsDNA virus sp.]
MFLKISNMKKFFSVLMMVFFCNVLFAQNDEVNLIKPIVESPAITGSQMRTFVAMNNYKNWGIIKLGLDSTMRTKTGKGVKICICDTGMPNHRDFNNGNIKLAESFIGGDGDVVDYNGHSTHVGGIILEIARESDLFFAKVLDKNGGGSITGVAAGINWCVDSKADIINLSLGSSQPSPIMKKAIDRAIEKGILVIAAAGNEGQNPNGNSMGYPAKYEETIAIGSINKNLDVSYFSSSGEQGDVVAPGESILSTWLNDEYIILSGTSMATPFVVGMAALKMEGGLDSVDFERIFENSANDMMDPGFDNVSFWGYVTPKFYNERDTSIVEPPVVENPNQKITNWTPIIVGGVFIIILLLMFFKGKKNDGT